MVDSLDLFERLNGYQLDDKPKHYIHQKWVPLKTGSAFGYAGGFAGSVCKNHPHYNGCKVTFFIH